MVKVYSTKLAIRIMVFAAAILFYFTDKTSLIISNHRFMSHNGITPVHVFWIILAAEMLQKCFPQKVTSMGCRKQFKSNYTPSEKKPAQSELSTWIKEENNAARKVFAIWLGGNVMVAVLYFTKILGETEMVLLSLFYSVCDLTCVLFYCPFQSFIMKNRCCVSCRIFNWDSIMICTPLIFIPSFFSWSLVSLALFLLIRWEYTYWRHPLRFYEGSNENLQCRHCDDNLCKVKKHAYLHHINS